jgi:uncharacterized phage infection (PIP) family protein YhgE
MVEVIDAEILQDNGIAQSIGAGIAAIASDASRNAAASEELNASSQQVATTSQELARVAEELAQSVQRFQLKGGQTGYDNRAVSEKNRLFVALRGSLGASEIKRACQDILQHAQTLRPGFGTISDISTFVPTSESGRQEIQMTMQRLKGMGMGHVVRIVPGTAKAAADLWQRSSQATGYQAAEAPTQADAERLMDMLERQGRDRARLGRQDPSLENRLSPA